MRMITFKLTSHLNYISRIAICARDAIVIMISGLFNKRYYLSIYQDIAKSKMPVLLHYVMWGAKEKRNPNPFFNTSYYLATNPDVGSSSINPLVHYILHGAKEGRIPHPYFSSEWYLDDYKAIARNGINPLRCYLENGHRHYSPQILPPRTVTKGNIACLRGYYREQATRELIKLIDRGEPLTLPLTDMPLVSVIIVLYNQAELTFRCLLSLSSERDVAIETIIVDNASADQTAILLNNVSGIKLIHNAENIGYLRAVNQAAKRARGKYLLLLNNDAELLPGSIGAAVDRLNKNDIIGAVGGRLILIDGTLQEAGSIIWKDGTCSGYGRGRDPTSPEFMFARPVDYCSGAFLMVRRSCFEELGGFDEMFAPAYYEEVDLCVRLWEVGRSVYYEPRAAVVHYEFGSSESSEKALEMQHKRKMLFAEKHNKYLSARHDRQLNCEIKARVAPEQYMGTILFIEDRVPHDDLGRGYPRTRAIVNEIVKQGWNVTFYPLYFPSDGWSNCYETIPDTVEVMLEYGEAKLPMFLKERKEYYDVIWISRPHNMIIYNKLVVPGFDNGGYKIYDAEALFALRDIAKCEVLGRPIGSEERIKLIDNELELAIGVDCVVAVSKCEAEYFKRRCHKVHVLAHRVERYNRPITSEGRNGLLHVGPLLGDDSPNVDGLAWFLENVWPLVININAKIELIVVGICESSRIKNCEAKNVSFLGRVECIEQYYDAAKIFIAPTRYSAGIPIKIYEAAARGLPVVGTSILAKQLDWEDGNEMLVADSVEMYAAKIMKLYANPELWHRISATSYEAIMEEGNEIKHVERIRYIMSGAVKLINSKRHKQNM